MQGQLAVAAQRSEVLFGIIPGLTAKFFVVEFLSSTSDTASHSDARPAASSLVGHRIQAQATRIWSQ